MAEMEASEKAKAAGAPAAAGAAQTQMSGAAAQPASFAAQPVVVKGSAGANYAGRGNNSVRDSVKNEDDYSDINLRRRRRTGAGSIGL
jgi:hypothetical protein